jgi:hypothetical protein
MKRILSRGYPLKEQQWSPRGGLRPASMASPGAVDHHGLPGGQRAERALRRREARRVYDTSMDIRDFPGLPLGAAVGLGEDHVLKHGPQVLAVDPE